VGSLHLGLVRHRDGESTNSRLHVAEMIDGCRDLIKILQQIRHATPEQYVAQIYDSVSNTDAALVCNTRYASRSRQILKSVIS
jgi:hypothetical protein